MPQDMCYFVLHVLNLWVPNTKNTHKLYKCTA